MTSSTSTSFWQAIERARIHRGAQDSLSEQIDADSPRGNVRSLQDYRRSSHYDSLRRQSAREGALADAALERAYEAFEAAHGVVAAEEFERMENAFRGL